MAHNRSYKRQPDSGDIEPIRSHKRQNTMDKNQEEENNDLGAVDARVSTTESSNAASKGKDGTNTIKTPLKSRRRVEGPVRLLSLDGGGVRGLSSIMIVKRIMERVNADRASGTKMEPWQFFDMIGGTSTGGIIAIMLGRLRMSLEDCSKAYLELSEQIFTPARYRGNFIARSIDFMFLNGKFDTYNFESAIKEFVGKYSTAGTGDLLKTPDESCKVFVAATRVTNSEPALLRSYENLKSSQVAEDCKIWEACRATSAATGIFDGITIGKFKQKFVDGGLLYNNPIQLVHREAEKIWPERDALVISIGTGSAPCGRFEGNIKKVVEAMKNILTQTERTADDFYQSHRAMVDNGLLFRFNVTQGLAQIGLEEYKEVDSIADATQTYLDNGETEQKMKACVKSLLGTQSEVTQRKMKLQTISTWLSPLNFMEKQTDLIEKRQEGTGQWFLDTVEYTKWVSSSRTYIWCTGIPGAGKSVLASIVVDDLIKKTKNNTDIGVVCLYLDEQAKAAQSPVNLLAALWRQLSAENGSLEDVEDLYERRSKAATRPKLEEVSKLLRAELCKYTQTFVIVDALDECPEHDGIRDILLEELSLLPGSVNILFTARNPPPLCRHFPNVVPMEIRAAKQDVTKYLQGQMSRLQDCVRTDPALQQAIVDAIINAIDGMFLLARLHIESLRDTITLREVKNALASLPKGSHALHSTYDDAMKRIESQMKRHQDRAKSILSWLIQARRPLTAIELQHALAVNPEDTDLDPEAIPHEDALTQYCMGLVTVDKPSNIVQLVHTTIREYFESSRNNTFPNAERSIAIVCLTYISFNVFTRDPCLNGDEVKIRVKQHPLLDYAARHWSEHVRSAPEDDVKDFVLRFLEKEPNRQCCSLLNWGIYGHVRKFPRYETSFHVAADLGLTSVMQSLLNRGGDFHAKDEAGMIAIQIAAKAGHTEIVRLLSESEDFRVNSKIYEGQTLLSWAADQGYDQTVKLLTLRSDVEIDSMDEEGQTALSHAAENGHKESARLLLARGAMVGSEDAKRETSLHKAAWSGHLKVMQLLFKYGAETEARNLEGETPLFSAALNEKGKAVSLLVRKGADLEAKNISGKNPLQATLYYLLVEGTRSLLHNGANLQVDNEDGSTALHDISFNFNDRAIQQMKEPHSNITIDYRTDLLGPALCSGGHEEMVQLLLMQGLDIESKDCQGQTALHYAVSTSHEVLAKVLLRHGANIEATDNDRGSPVLHFAAGKGNEAMVLLLLDKGANIEGSDKYGLTALHLAVHAENESMARLLLGKGANVNSQVPPGIRPLHIATLAGDRAMVELLLERRALLEVSDPLGYTPLILASVCGNKEIVEILLANGANIAARDRDGGTALVYAEKNEDKSLMELLRGHSPSM